MTKQPFPTISAIDAADMATLSAWWKSLPPPKSDEEKDVIERFAIRAEGCGLVDEFGNLK